MFGGGGLQLHHYIQFLGISVTAGHFKEDKKLSHTFVTDTKFMLYSVSVILQAGKVTRTECERQDQRAARGGGTTDSAHHNITLSRSLGGNV